MKYGLTTEDLENLIQILKPLITISPIFVFGSRARGDHKPFSDLDLLIENAVSKSILSQVRERLEESSIPIKVDLVLAADLNAHYRDQIQREKIKLNLN